VSRRQVYTLPPLTREQWAALDPRNRYRARISLDDGQAIGLTWRAGRAEAEQELAAQLPGFREIRQRHPYMAQVTGGDVEDRGEGLDLPGLILRRLAELRTDPG
jgi:hypothetical protein